MKKCTRCGETKPFDQFHRALRHSGDGYYPHCKACRKHDAQKPVAAAQRREVNRRYRERHPERYALSQSKYQQSEKRREAMRRYRQTDKAKALYAAYYRRHPERFRAREKVVLAVEAGRLPRADALSCTACGRVAEEYHHYLGYAAEHALDVVPLCEQCHKAIHLPQPRVRQR